MVSKLEEHAHAISINLISEIHADFQRIFGWRKVVGSNLIPQRSAAPLGGRLDEMPRFGAKKSVIAASDLVSAIKTVFILKSVKVVTHDRGVICPALLRHR